MKHIFDIPTCSSHEMLAGRIMSPVRFSNPSGLSGITIGSRHNGISQNSLIACLTLPRQKRDNRDRKIPDIN